MLGVRLTLAGWETGRIWVDIDAGWEDSRCWRKEGRTIEGIVGSLRPPTRLLRLKSFGLLIIW